ncbi:MAG: hypothetical protein MUF10_09720 [Thermoanaerobaculaceae bacterium]|nr:hypothetical protein [Thermoanaerobaculaceae bacterium]
MHDRPTGEELVALVRQALRPQPDEKALPVLVDVPDAAVPDGPAWRARCGIACEWVGELPARRDDPGRDTHPVHDRIGANRAVEVLLDGDLGLHSALGRSDHIEGQMVPRRVSSPTAAVHIDCVCVPDRQPDVLGTKADLLLEDETISPLIRDGDHLVEP